VIVADLASRHCRRLASEETPLAPEVSRELLDHLHGDWSLNTERTEIERTFAFKNYYRTLAFVNAVAWIAHQEDHHPEMEVGYNRCRVRYSTHSVGGLSENDFICAAKVDALSAAD
jgi:4a-hydroxytetrahydrobiopterin dehydratase